MSHHIVDIICQAQSLSTVDIPLIICSAELLNIVTQIGRVGYRSWNMRNALSPEGDLIILEPHSHRIYSLALKSHLQTSSYLVWGPSLGTV